MRRAKKVLGAGVAIAAAATLTVIGSQSGFAQPEKGQKPSGGTTESAESLAVTNAQKNFAANPELTSSSPDQTVKARDVVKGKGVTHVRADRFYKGLKVIGGDLVLHQTKSGTLKSVSGAEMPKLSVSTKAAISAPKAANVGAKSVSFKPSVSKPTLVVDVTSGKPVLSYQTNVRGTDKDGAPAGENVYVNAETGKVTRAVPTVVSEKGTGKSLYLGDLEIDTTKDGETFAMVDPERGNGETRDAKNSDNMEGDIFTDDDNAWGDGTNNDRASAGVDAHFGVAKTWDYYKEIHQRNGIADDGKGAKSFVHLGNGLVNAFWDDQCFCMGYGDGDGTETGPLVTLDVAGHEMSHGVTSRTAGLEYVGESGGLNEATSDIFGNRVEAYAANEKDPGDYVVGETIFLEQDPATKYIRRMDKPSADGNSFDCYEDGIGDVDVHYSSGLANHFFYLLAEGSGAKDINGVPHESVTCDGTDVEGIGADKAEAIWYKALTAYMTSTTDYKGARQATLDAAKELYGADSAEYKAVDTVWTSVKVTG